MVDYGSKSIPEFYRVHVKLEDGDDISHLSFDFPDRQLAAVFADQAYMSCDLYKVWTEIVVNEITTTESPMWRR